MLTSWRQVWCVCIPERFRGELLTVRCYRNLSSFLPMIVVNLTVNRFLCDAATAAGCADVTPPRHTWMRRTGDVVEVGCPTTDKRWTLTCTGGRWNGEMANTCPGVPGVYLPGDNVPPSTTSDESDSLFASIPISKLSRDDDCISLTTGCSWRFFCEKFNSFRCTG